MINFKLVSDLLANNQWNLSGAANAFFLAEIVFKIMNKYIPNHPNENKWTWPPHPWLLLRVHHTIMLSLLTWINRFLGLDGWH